MRSTHKFNITLPKEMAEAVKAKVASGEYASESEVIYDGIRALLARDQALTTWLHEEVATAYDEAQADPASLVSAADVRAQLDARYVQAKR